MNQRLNYPPGSILSGLLILFSFPAYPDRSTMYSISGEWVADELLVMRPHSRSALELPLFLSLPLRKLHP
ncbi:MAG TPA: hypothetical protein VKA49_20395 [Flavitalea sp.]|nr:hypothetical protein [Flavitalea sp.]